MNPTDNFFPLSTYACFKNLTAVFHIYVLQKYLTQGVIYLPVMITGCLGFGVVGNISGGPQKLDLDIACCPHVILT